MAYLYHCCNDIISFGECQGSTQEICAAAHFVLRRIDLIEMWHWKFLEKNVALPHVMSTQRVTPSPPVNFLRQCATVCMYADASYQYFITHWYVYCFSTWQSCEYVLSFIHEMESTSSHLMFDNRINNMYVDGHARDERMPENSNQNQCSFVMRPAISNTEVLQWKRANIQLTW